MTRTSHWPPVPPDVDEPDETELLDQLTAAVGSTEVHFPTSCPHGCTAEADGSCPDGHPSWLVRYGLI